MGRELKRVPLDFSWPIGQLWKGFINPFRSQKCESCDGSGQNPATKKLSEEWYGDGLPEKWQYPDGPRGRRWNDSAWCNHLTELEVWALIQGRRLMDFTHVPLNEFQAEEVRQKIANGGNGWLPYNNGYVPSAQEINEWQRGPGFGHDGINKWICVKIRAEAMGIYGYCAICEGTGELWVSDAVRELHENWVDFEPPVGDGFQLWSTTTQGHPMTPVFPTLEVLCEYCENEGVSVFAHSTATKAEWMQMLNDDFVYHKEGNAIFI